MDSLIPKSFKYGLISVAIMFFFNLVVSIFNMILLLLR